MGGRLTAVESSAADKPVNLTMVTYNRVGFTRQSIESIGPTAGHPFELTVVDNASTDGTREVLADLHERGLIHRLILNDANLGVAYAANQGWHARRGCTYLKVDNDIVFRRQGWLARIVAVSAAVRDLGAVAYNFEVTSYQLRTVDGYSVRPKRGNVGGACVLIPERVHARIGYWCEDYWPYGEEDFDLSVRLGVLGLRSYYMEDEDVGLHLPEGRASPLLDGGRRSAFDEGDAGYRRQKDEWRTQHTGTRGVQRINAFLYRARLRPLYIEHGVPYSPTTAARIAVALRFRRRNWWRAAGVPGITAPGG